MAKLSFSCVLLLLVLCSVALMGPAVEAQKRCSVVLDPNACELSKCRQQCYESKNGNGVCEPDPNFNYKCVCNYNCGANA